MLYSAHEPVSSATARRIEAQSVTWKSSSWSDVYCASPAVVAFASCSRRAWRWVKQCAVTDEPSTASPKRSHAVTSSSRDAVVDARNTCEPSTVQPASAGALTAGRRSGGVSTRPVRVCELHAESNWATISGTTASTRRIATVFSLSAASAARSTATRSATPSASSGRIAASAVMRPSSTRGAPSSATSAAASGEAVSRAASWAGATRWIAARASSKLTVNISSASADPICAGLVVRVCASYVSTAAGHAAASPRTSEGWAPAAAATCESDESERRSALPFDDWPSTSARPATRAAASSRPAANARTTSPLFASSHALVAMPWSAGVVPVTRETATETRSRGMNDGSSSTAWLCATSSASLGNAAASTSASVRPSSVRSITACAGASTAGLTSGIGAGNAVARAPATCATSGAMLVSDMADGPAASPAPTRTRCAASAARSAPVRTISPLRPGKKDCSTGLTTTPATSAAMVHSISLPGELRQTRQSRSLRRGR
mmetsp:Transcript_940/g.2525  ORF Transcript_940/g.2525 Transcript_940/m.2525 type:complete len:494 (-) Transcript_940:22-1503(-)